jgi:hypothetical protein
VGKVGFEVTNDVDMGFMRWLTIALPSDPERHLLLEVPGPPTLSEESRQPEARPADQGGARRGLRPHRRRLP